MQKTTYELNIERTPDGEEIRIALTRDEFFNLYELGLRVMGSAGIIQALKLNDRDAKVLAAHASALYAILFETEALTEFLEEEDNVEVKKEMVS